MYFEEEIAAEKAYLQYELDDGFITESQYHMKLAEIENREYEYFNSEW